MKNIAILQPSELGDDFYFDQAAGVWKVNFPAPVESNVTISPNTNNLIKTGSDGGAWVDASKLIAHALVQDTDDQKIHLYRFPAGTTFDVAKATLVGSIDMVEMNGVFDDIAINGNNIKFTDAQNGVSISLDVDSLQRVSRINGSNSVRVTAGANPGEIALSVITNPSETNLLQVIEGEEGGLLVSGFSVRDYIQGLVDGINSQQSIRLNVNGDTVEVKRTIGKQQLRIPQLAIVGSNGNVLAYADDVTTPLEGETIPEV